LKDLQNQLQTLAERIQNCSTKKNVVKHLQQVKGIGPFFAWQILCDLQEALNLEFGSWFFFFIVFVDVSFFFFFVLREEDENTWVLLGPGAREGITLIFRSNSSTSREQLRLAIDLFTNQERYFQLFDLQFPYWEGKRLSLKNIGSNSLPFFPLFLSKKNLPTHSALSFTEHTLCDFHKYYEIRYCDRKCLSIYHRPSTQGSQFAVGQPVQWKGIPAVVAYYGNVHFSEQPHYGIEFPTPSKLTNHNINSNKTD
jgi:hypothetical protein